PAVPFIDITYIFNRDVFLEQGQQSYVVSNTEERISGHDYNFNVKNVLKSSIGEWIERYTLFKNSYKENERLLSFNLVNREVKKVNADKIFILDGPTFNDTCGVASHLSSKRTIEAAFNEFFERQSLVYRWLTKTGGKRIDVTLLENKEINYLYNKAFNFIDKLHIIDISIHHSFSVILTVGIGKFYKAISLSANQNIVEATVNSLEELFQSFSDDWTKQYFESKDCFLGFSKNESIKHDLYKDYYFNISPENFYKEYEFLLTDSSNVKSISNYRYTNKPFKDVIKTVSEDLNLEFYCCFIPNQLEHLETKIVKVYSPDGYPHMFPTEFTEEETRLRFNHETSMFPNQYKQIPFP